MLSLRCATNFGKPLPPRSRSPLGCNFRQSIDNRPSMVKTSHGMNKRFIMINPFEPNEPKDPEFEELNKEYGTYKSALHTYDELIELKKQADSGDPDAEVQVKILEEMDRQLLDIMREGEELSNQVHYKAYIKEVKQELRKLHGRYLDSDEPMSARFMQRLRKEHIELVESIQEKHKELWARAVEEDAAEIKKYEYEHHVKGRTALQKEGEPPLRFAKPAKQFLLPLKNKKKESMKDYKDLMFVA